MNDSKGLHIGFLLTEKVLKLNNDIMIDREVNREVHCWFKMNRKNKTALPPGVISHCFNHYMYDFFYFSLLRHVRFYRSYEQVEGTTAYYLIVKTFRISEKTLHEYLLRFISRQNICLIGHSANLCS